MARRPRVEYPGALYHVITRGNQRQKIFFDDQDRIKYLEILSRLKGLYRFRLYAYVLMLNHVHLLLEAGEVPLSRIMQRLGSGYTQYFNRRHGLVGHLFQGRYKAILCDKDSYLLELSRYLHLNPVRAKVVKDPADYIWSSYGGYVRETNGQKWLDIREVLGQFSRNRSEARRLYRKFVLEAIGEGHKQQYYEVLDGRFLGDREFAEDIKAKIGSPGYVRVRIKPETFVAMSCAALGKKRAEVTGSGKDRERVRAREVISYVGRSCTELSVTALAQTLGVDPTCVTRSVARVESRLSDDKELKRTVAAVVGAIENSKYQA
ncbi:MAG TPA: transposase [Candidatus Acidoferrales bacterium]|nr:transposase [Candidatus Acidoferrales bacterium]